MQLHDYITLVAEIGGVATVVGTIATGATYLIYSIVKGKSKSEMDKLQRENTITDYYEKQNQAQEKIINNLNTRIDTYLKNQGSLEAQVNAEKKRNDKLEAELRLRNPEMKAFMELMLKHSEDSMNFMRQQETKDNEKMNMYGRMIQLLDDIHSNQGKPLVLSGIAQKDKRED